MSKEWCSPLWKIVQEANLIIENKVASREIVCEYCHKTIKRKRYTVAWKFSDRILKKKRQELKDWSNLRYVRFSHPSCAKRYLDRKLFGKLDEKS